MSGNTSETFHVQKKVPRGRFLGAHADCRAHARLYVTDKNTAPQDHRRWSYAVPTRRYVMASGGRRPPTGEEAAVIARDIITVKPAAAANPPDGRGVTR